MYVTCCKFDNNNNNTFVFIAPNHSLSRISHFETDNLFENQRIGNRRKHTLIIYSQDEYRPGFP